MNNNIILLLLFHIAIYNLLMTTSIAAANTTETPYYDLSIDNAAQKICLQLEDSRLAYCVTSIMLHLKDSSQINEIKKANLRKKLCQDILSRRDFPYNDDDKKKWTNTVTLI